MSIIIPLLLGLLDFPVTASLVAVSYPQLHGRPKAILLTIHLVRSIGFVYRFENVDGPSWFEHLVRYTQPLALLAQLIHGFDFLWRELNLDQILRDPRRVDGFGNRNVSSGFRPCKPLENSSISIYV
jgi:hypothetical protein